LISVPGPDRANVPTLVYSTEVQVLGAAWLRLWFADTWLPGDPAADGAFLRLTSLFDGATQHLDAQSLAWWSNSSAYFNGDAVRVELFAFPSTGHARVAIRSVTVGEIPPYADRSICGTLDDRALSSDPRTGREIVVGVNSPCTAWLIDDANRTLLSAGHCAPAPPSVIQFNCPLSDANGVAQHPPPADQYPIDGTSPQTVNGGVGNDFSYFATLPNTETGRTAYQSQQSTFRLASAAPSSTTGRDIRITGYGSTSTGVSRTWNFAQKTHAGPYVGLSGNVVRYATDTTGGNSGSAVEDLLSGLAIGIHTHAGCSSTGGSNQGTAIQLPALQDALANPRGVCRSGRAAPQPNASIFLAGDLNNTAGSINTSTGAYSTIVGQDAGLVRFQGLAFDPFGNRLFAIADQRLIYPLGSPFQSSWPIIGTSQTLNALAFDAQTRTLYAIAQATGQLFRLSPTGEATPIGPPRGGRVGALEFDHARGVLFALDDTTSGAGTCLIRINTSDGSHTLVGPLGAGITDCNGLASNGALFTVDAVNRNLYRINPDTGAATLVGATRAMLGASFGMGGFDPTPRCFADVNADGGVSIDDLLLYLDLFAQGQLAADIDDGTRAGIMDGGVTIDDLLWYLARFEEGC
jgi:V8-like Glu-specific endopeptidase